MIQQLSVQLHAAFKCHKSVPTSSCTRADRIQHHSHTSPEQVKPSVAQTHRLDQHRRHTMCNGSNTISVRTAFTACRQVLGGLLLLMFPCMGKRSSLCRWIVAVQGGQDTQSTSQLARTSTKIVSWQGHRLSDVCSTVYGVRKDVRLTCSSRLCCLECFCYCSCCGCIDRQCSLSSCCQCTHHLVSLLCPALRVLQQLTCHLQENYRRS